MRRLEWPTMIFAGDIGGSHVRLGLFETPAHPDGRPPLVHWARYRTHDYAALAGIITAFLSGRDACLSEACLGVAGPVLGDEVVLTNVPWRVHGRAVAAQLGLPSVRLINDLEAMATAVPLLTADELHVLQPGRPDPTGSAVLVAAGTGLGEAVLHRVDGRLRPLASEAGHTDLTARTDRELELLRFVRDRFGRADLERVLSGPGLANIAHFTHGAPACAVAGWTTGDADAAARIDRGAASRQCTACAEAVALFVDAYGAEAGNLALRAVATGGVYLGGGMAPKMLAALEADGAFLRAFRAKPPMDGMLATVPVSVILNEQTGLLGAASAAVLG